MLNSESCNMLYNNQALNEITCAGFVMKTLDNKIVLVKNANGKYSFPKGKYEKKKDGAPKSLNTLYNCALRELIEETQMFNYEFITTQDLANCYIEKTNILYFPAVIVKLDNNFVIDFMINDELEELHFLSLDKIQKLSDDKIKNERKKIAINHLLNASDCLENNKYNYNQTINYQTLNQQTLNQQPNKQTQMDKSRETAISKKMSYFLRHHLDEITNNVTPDGYVKLSDLLKHKDFIIAKVTKEEVEYVVASNEKQRFKLIINESNGEQMIRANQGHSISETNISGKIDQNLIYTKIIEPLNYCVHGTTRKAINEIRNLGLNKMSRTHIHFASKPNAISGFRGSSNVLVHVDMAKAMDDGIEFFMSDNEVILSEGPIDPKYFSKVEFI